MALIICSSIGGFMGFSYGTIMFAKYQNNLERDLASLPKEKNKISEDL